LANLIWHLAGSSVEGASSPKNETLDFRPPVFGTGSFPFLEKQIVVLVVVLVDLVDQEIF
jgi:hypothetical protein